MDPGRANTLLQEARVVHDQHGSRVTEVFDDVVPHVVEDFVRVPVAAVQQPVHAVGSRVAGFLGRRPAVLPFQRGYQAPHRVRQC